MREQVRKHSNDLVLATTADGNPRRSTSKSKIAALMGVEGGHMINSDLGVLREYRGAGRPVHDADPQRKRRMGRFVDGQAGAQRADAISAKTSCAR